MLHDHRWPCSTAHWMLRGPSTRLVPSQQAVVVPHFAVPHGDARRPNPVNLAQSLINRREEHICVVAATWPRFFYLASGPCLATQF
jgi:hypothetical protein